MLSKINDIDPSILTTTNTIFDDKNNIINQQHLLSVHSNGIPIISIFLKIDIMFVL